MIDTSAAAFHWPQGPCLGDEEVAQFAVQRGREESLCGRSPWAEVSLGRVGEARGSGAWFVASQRQPGGRSQEVERDGCWGLGVRMGHKGLREKTGVDIRAGRPGRLQGGAEEVEIVQPAPLVQTAWGAPGRGAQEASCGLRGRMDTGKGLSSAEPPSASARGSHLPCRPTASHHHAPWVPCQNPKTGCEKL